MKFNNIFYVFKEKVLFLVLIFKSNVIEKLIALIYKLIFGRLIFMTSLFRLKNLEKKENDLILNFLEFFNQHFLSIFLLVFNIFLLIIYIWLTIKKKKDYIQSIVSLNTFIYSLLIYYWFVKEQVKLLNFTSNSIENNIFLFWNYINTNFFNFSSLIILLLYIIGFLVYKWYILILKQQNIIDVEFIIVINFMACAILELFSCTSFLSFILFLEIYTLSTLILVPYENKFLLSTESGLKYFIVASFSTISSLSGILGFYLHFGTIDFLDLNTFYYKYIESPWHLFSGNFLYNPDLEINDIFFQKWFNTGDEWKRTFSECLDIQRKLDYEIIWNKYPWLPTRTEYKFAKNLLFNDGFSYNFYGFRDSFFRGEIKKVEAWWEFYATPRDFKEIKNWIYSNKLEHSEYGQKFNKNPNSFFNELILDENNKDINFINLRKISEQLIAKWESSFNNYEAYLKATASCEGLEYARKFWKLQKEFGFWINNSSYFEDHPMWLLLDIDKRENLFFHPFNIICDKRLEYFLENKENFIYGRTVTDADLEYITLVKSIVSLWKEANFITDNIKFSQVMDLINAFREQYPEPSSKYTKLLLDDFSIFAENYIEDRFWFIVFFTLIITSLLIKLGIAPFHTWILDTYIGTNIWTMFYLSIISKASLLFVSLYILNTFVLIENIYLQLWIICIILISSCISVIGGISQITIKRFLFYSSLSNMVYFIVALSFNPYTSTITASTFYVIFYSAIVLILFIALFLLHTRSDEKLFLNNFYSYTNLVRTEPITALILSILLFIMGAIPPSFFFIIKLFLLEDVYEKGSIFLVILLLLLSVIQVYVYTRLIKVIFIFSETHWFFLIRPSYIISLVISISFILGMIISVFFGPSFNILLVIFPK